MKLFWGEIFIFHGNISHRAGSRIREPNTLVNEEMVQKSDALFYDSSVDSDQELKTIGIVQLDVP